MDTPKSRFYKNFQTFYKIFCKIFVKLNFSRKTIFFEKSEWYIFSTLSRRSFSERLVQLLRASFEKQSKTYPICFLQKIYKFFCKCRAGVDQKCEGEIFLRKIKRHVSHGEAYQFLAPDCHSRSRYNETKCSRGNPPSGPSRRGDLI